MAIFNSKLLKNYQRVVNWEHTTVDIQPEPTAKFAVFAEHPLPLPEFHPHHLPSPSIELRKRQGAKGGADVHPREVLFTSRTSHEFLVVFLNPPGEGWYDDTNG